MVGGIHRTSGYLAMVNNSLHECPSKLDQRGAMILEQSISEWRLYSMQGHGEKMF